VFGAISSSDVDAAVSQSVNYQEDAVALAVSSGNNDSDDLASKEDKPEDPQTPVNVSMSAIGWVSFVYLFSIIMYVL